MPGGEFRLAGRLPRGVFIFIACDFHELLGILQALQELAGKEPRPTPGSMPAKLVV
jgi:hypothetical protein